jgi:hypothetical protein
MAINETLAPLPALPKMARMPRPKINKCECGCGHLTGNRFVPGHDSRLRGWVLRLERGLVTPDQIPQGEREAAMRELTKQGKAANTIVENVPAVVGNPRR